MMFSIFGSQIGFCCTYLIYITHTVHKLLGEDVSVWVCMAVFIWVLILLVWLPSLRFLAPTSLFASAAIVAVCGLVLYVGSTPSVQANMKVPWDMPLLKIETFSVFFGIACFAYTVQGVILSFELQMAKPEDFNKVIRTAIFLVMVIYATIGCAGYIYFQENTDAPITNNLDDIKEIPSWLSMAVKTCLSLALICCYPLQMLPVVLVTEKALLDKNSHRLLSYVIRTSLVLGTGVVAEIVPFFGLFAGLVGGLTCASMTCIMPCLCYLKLNWSNVTKLEIFMNGGIASLGIIASASSTIITLVQLIDCFKDSSGDACK
jgi:amino acid permease